jgi:hypothetical protein
MGILGMEKLEIGPGLCLDFLEVRTFALARPHGRNQNDCKLQIDTSIYGCSICNLKFAITNLQ